MDRHTFTVAEKYVCGSKKRHRLTVRSILAVISNQSDGQSRSPGFEALLARLFARYLPAFLLPVKRGSKVDEIPHFVAYHRDSIYAIYNAVEKACILSAEVFSTISWDGSQHRNAASQTHEVLSRIPF